MSAVIVVHGGVKAKLDERDHASVDGVKAAACDGFAVLKRGGSPLDAVEAAVKAMEDNSVFNAGHGAVLNAEGEVEMDALIMDGKTLSSGAVSSVKGIANPVSLARLVMEKTDHMILTSRGANQFAESLGMTTVPTDSLVTEYERKKWKNTRTYVSELSEEYNTQWAHDTVGAVAVDSVGNVACATSTGGIRCKMAGRVGDAPIIGCGGYADNFSGAVSCSGHGESILKVTLARLILLHVEQGKSVAESSQLALQYMADRVHGAGGCVVVSPSGQWAATFTTKRMVWAAVDHDGLWYGLDPNERFSEQLTV
ncbi:isoaspartyl peptidase/L-asparaginase-like [Antennarius striatus]|uniref:isoaspartyl peptidase/L-asparaginase-like n=1 Tax=Antennarius striatus TaxID=241820 RepID=UPI0035B21502